MRAWIAVGIMLLMVGCANQGAAVRSQASNQLSDEQSRALQAYLELGLGYLESGYPEQALRPLQRARQIAPTHPDVYNAWGMMFGVQGEYELAEQEFTQALERYPQDARLRNNYGAFLFTRGRIDEACAQVAISAKDPLYPQRAQAFENLGRCALMQGDLEQAKQHYNRAVKFSPLSARLWFALAQVDVKAEDFQQAMVHYNYFHRLVSQGYAAHTRDTLVLGRLIAERTGNAAMMSELSNWAEKQTP